MQRPRLKEPRSRQLNLSFSNSELQSIVERAQAVGMRPCHYGRALLLRENQAVAAAARPSVSNIDHRVHQQLSRIGNNLNQMIRHLHATGDPLPADAEPLLADIRALMAKLVR